MSNNLPLVSILICSYNQIEFLKESIESAINQTYPNIEIIISDDSSKDGSIELIQYYEKEYPKIIKAYFAEQNRGMVGNFNFLLTLGKGKYVVKLDGDDMLMLDCVEVQVKFLEENPHFSGSYSNLDIFDSFTGNTIANFISNKRPARKGILKNVIKYGCFYHGSFSMYKRDLISQTRFEHEANSVADYHFMIKYLYPNGELGYVDKVLGRYRIHEENMTKNRNKLILHTIWAVGLVIKRYPSYTFNAIFRLFDAFRAVITKRNAWL